MEKTKILMISLFLFSAAVSAASDLTYYVEITGTEETGQGRSLWHSVGYNCTEKMFYARMSDGPDALDDVSLYLFYTDYAYQLITTSRTDATGSARLSMIGNEKFLNNLFVLRAEKSGYKDVEIEFTVNCSKVAPPQPANFTNATANQSSLPNGSNNSFAGNWSANASSNASFSNNSQNNTPIAPPSNYSGGAGRNNSSQQGGNQGAIPCAPAFILLAAGALAFFRSR